MLQRLDADIKQALLSGDKARVEVLKMLKSSALLAEKESGPLDEARFYEVVRKQLKMREDAISLYEKAGSNEKADKEKSEAIILKEYLPEQMGIAELNATIEDIVSSAGLEFERKNMGTIIGLVSAQVGDSASKSDIAKAINTKIH